MDENQHLFLNPNERLRSLIDNSVLEVNPAVPLNRYYRSLNEMYRVAGSCVRENDLERAFLLYLRFVTLAINELPKHRDYNGFSSDQKKKAEASLQTAFECAETLKEKLKEKFELDAAAAKKSLEERKAEVLCDGITLNDRKMPTAPLRDVARDENGVGLQLSPVRIDRLQDRTTRVSCRMVIAGEIVEKFRKKVEGNTSSDIETCAVLCGITKEKIYYVTHAVIPKQDGTPNSCDMRCEEEIFAFQDAHNLISLGWIHTHPTQSAFLSSVDLHTHHSYQQLLPEAIAIVVAPKFNQVGYFRLSKEGMREVGSCRESGFHLHKNKTSLFCECDDVFVDKSINAEVFDLR